MSGPKAKVLVIVRRPSDGALLVSGDHDEAGSGYERPLGGHIEFGERSVEAVCRELREEIGQEVENTRLLGVMENLFTLDGSPGHEVVFLYEADFADSSAYEIEQQSILDDNTGKVRVRWRGPNESSPPLVPAGLEQFLEPDVS